MEIGTEFTDLTVTGCVGAKISCTCICGTELVVQRCNLLSGKVKSCGCRRKSNRNKIKKYTRQHPLYSVWWNMKQRCSYEKSPGYARYGGRGITVCEEWQNFQTFCEWALSKGWEKGLQVDRIDNNANYCPDNCQLLCNRDNSIKDQRPHNEVGYIGVMPRSGRFVAYIKVFGKVKWIGTFDTKEIAARERDLYVIANKLGYTLNFKYMVKRIL